MNIGIIGAGAIANFLLKEINQNEAPNLQVKSVLVRNREKYQSLEKQFSINLYTDMNDFINSDIDIVVEAANIEAVKAHLPTVLQKKPAVLISIGALADEPFLEKVIQLAEQYGNHVHLPSGAVGGLDLLQNAHALGGISHVSLTTRKPANTLIDEQVSEEVIVFEGKAADAITQFPKNINVSIVLSLAGIGMDKTGVTIIADPHIDKNIHQVDIKGDFGEASFTIKNNPLPENPKTSYLAAMSILGTLKKLVHTIHIGN